MMYCDILWKDNTNPGLSNNILFFSFHQEEKKKKKAKLLFGIIALPLMYVCSANNNTNIPTHTYTVVVARR